MGETQVRREFRAARTGVLAACLGVACTTTASNPAANRAGPPAAGDANTLPLDTEATNAANQVTFTTRTLETAFFAEGATAGDLNRDGAPDLIAGPLWYEGPTFAVRHAIADAPSFDVESYSRFFLTFVDDVDGDGWLDVLAVASPNGEMWMGDPNTYWYANPGESNDGAPWERHLVVDGPVSNESPAFTDLSGDGAADLVFMTAQTLGYAVRGDDPTAPWRYTAISDARFATPYVHGLGVGDLNGDERPDIVEKTGWWEQPASGETWPRHDFDFTLGGQGGAQMLVMDVNGDQRADVVTSLNAHGYGLAWFEQVAPGTFTSHLLLPQEPSPDNVSQLHALAAADFNGDGLTDFATGKRYLAHPSATPDPGSDEPQSLYWFELVRASETTFVPHLIHSSSGVGCSFVATDISGDGKPDLFTTNKRGTFVHTQD